MKILHFYKTSFPDSTGGVPVFIDTLCNATAALGVENTVLALSNNANEKPLKIGDYTVYQAQQNLFIASTGFSISAFSKFKKLVREADIIHYHFPNPFTDMLHFACKVKKPSVLTYHSDILKQKNLVKLYKPLMTHFLNSVSHIVATSPNYLCSSKFLQSNKNKTSVIPVGIDINNYPELNPERLKYWQERFPQPFFLFIGVLRYYKGLHTALDAIKGTDIQLVIGGTGSKEKNLHQQAKKNNLNNVHFLGFLSDEDKVALLNLCYAFVFPSHLRTEAFGISQLEAAYYEKPLICCEIGTGTSYVNCHQETGLVINPSSSQELKEAMQYLLDNPQRATEFGKNARNRATTLFTAEQQTKAYYELYQKLLQMKHHKTIRF